MVTKINSKYVIDEKGKAISVLLDIKANRKILGELEELTAIRAFDNAKAACDKAIPFEQAVKEIER